VPRFPASAPTAQSLSDRVFGALRPPASGPVFPLNVGDTYLEPLAAARAEAQRTDAHPRLHNYAPVQGEPELLGAIERKLLRRSGTAVERARIQVMSGATAAIGVLANTLLMPGDELLLPAPFWPLVRGAVQLRGAQAVEVPFYTRLDEPGFDPIAALEAQLTPRTVALYVNSPHNPTGRALDAVTLQRLVDFAVRHDLWLVADEVYEDLWYGAAPPPSIWTLPGAAERTLTTHSVSKAYGLAGARVGYTHGPAPVMEVVRSVQTFFTYCAPRPLQLGAARALDEGDGWLAEARGLYREAGRRAAEVLGLPAPEGGTFLFFDTRPHRLPGEGAHAFLERAAAVGVMLTPGAASGSHYEDWARLCYTSVPPDALELALARLSGLLGRR
jgi:N-succinyldiaminopimelate aminotransferase